MRAATNNVVPGRRLALPKDKKIYSTLKDVRTLYNMVSDELRAPGEVVRSYSLFTLVALCSEGNPVVAIAACSAVAKLFRQFTERKYQSYILSIVGASCHIPNEENLNVYVKLVLSLFDSHFTDKLIKGQIENYDILNTELKCREGPSPIESLLRNHPEATSFLCSGIREYAKDVRCYMFGSLIKQFLFNGSTPPYTEASYKTMFWKLFQNKDNSAVNFYYLMWSQLSDPEIFMQPFMNYYESPGTSCDAAALLAVHNDLNVMLNNSFRCEEHVEILPNVLKLCSHYTRQIAAMYIALMIDKYNYTFAVKMIDLLSVHICPHGLSYEVAAITNASLFLFLSKHPNAPPKVATFKDYIERKMDDFARVKIPIVTSPEVVYVSSTIPSLFEGVLLLRLMASLKEDEANILNWIKDLPSTNPKITPYKLLIYHYLLRTTSTKIKRQCYKVARQWKINTFLVDVYFHKSEKVDTVSKTKLLFSLFLKAPSKKDNVTIRKLLTRIENHPLEPFVGLGINLYRFLLRKFPLIYRDLDPLLKVSSDSVQEALVQIGTIKELLEASAETHGEECLFFLNRFINKWLNKDDLNGLLVAYAIDCLAILCQRSYINHVVIWEELMKVFGSDRRPSVMKSVIRFLGIIPLVEQNDTYDIVYKSAKILWYYATKGFECNKEALRALRNYNLSVFDATFLDPIACRNHFSLIPTHYKNGTLIYDHKGLKKKDVARPYIPVSCWIHLMLQAPVDHVSSLFSSLIKNATEDDIAHVNYQNFHDALIAFVEESIHSCGTEVPFSNPFVWCCLMLLNAPWKMLLIRYSMDQLHTVMKDGSTCSVRRLAFQISMKHEPYCINPSAEVDRWFLNVKDPKLCSDLILSLSDVLKRFKPNPCLEENLTKGLHYCFYTERTNKREAIQAILTAFKNSQIPIKAKTLLFTCCVHLFLNEAHDAPGTILLIQLMSRLEKPLLSKIPIEDPNPNLLKKFIRLFMEISLRSRLFRDFQPAIQIVLDNEKNLQDNSIRKYFQVAFHHVLQSLGRTSSKKNKMWVESLLRLVIQETLPSNLPFEIFVLVCDACFGTSHFSMRPSLNTAVAHLPYSMLQYVARLSSSKQEILKILYEWADSKCLRPIYVEAIFFTILAVKNLGKENKIDCSPFVQLHTDMSDPYA